MVGSNYALVTYSAYEFTIPEAEDLIARGKVDGGNMYVYNAYCQKTSADAAAEVSEDHANELSASAVPIVVYVDSADAKDDDGGVGAQAVTLWGINSAGTGYTSDTIATGGAGPAYTKGAVLFQEIFPPYVSSVGTDKDNVAEVAITSAAGATEYYAIAIGKNKTGAIHVWIAPGWRAKIVDMSIEPATAAAADTMTNAIIDGVRINLAQTGGSFNETHETFTKIYKAGKNMYSQSDSGEHQFDVFKKPVFPLGGVDTVNVKVAFGSESFDDGDHVLLDYHVTWLLWKEA